MIQNTPRPRTKMQDSTTQSKSVPFQVRMAVSISKVLEIEEDP